MLVIGILFLVFGLYFILSEIYTVKRINDELVFSRKKVDINTGFFKYKILMGIFSTVLGVFSIINIIVY